MGEGYTATWGGGCGFRHVLMNASLTPCSSFDAKRSVVVIVLQIALNLEARNDGYIQRNTVDEISNMSHTNHAASSSASCPTSLLTKKKRLFKVRMIHWHPCRGGGGVNSWNLPPSYHWNKSKVILTWKIDIRKELKNMTSVQGGQEHMITWLSSIFVHTLHVLNIHLPTLLGHCENLTMDEKCVNYSIKKTTHWTLKLRVSSGVSWPSIHKISSEFHFWHQVQSVHKK